MIEPRRSFILLSQRRDSNEFHSFYTGTGGNSSEEEEDDSSRHSQQHHRIVIEHDEPEIPIHPALEYEVVEAQVQPRRKLHHRPRRRRRKRRVVVLSDWKLVVSFVGLVIFGAGNSISLKLQSIPMYNYPNFLNLFCNIIYIPICFAYIIPAAIRRRLCRRSSGTRNNPQEEDNREEEEEEEEREATQSTRSSSQDLLLSRDESRLLPEALLRSMTHDNNNDDSLRTPLLSVERSFNNNHNLPRSQSSSPPPSSSSSPAESIASSSSSSTTTTTVDSSSSSRSPSFHDFAIMGLLDSLATTMQIFAAVYLPGPLLILLPQAAIPLSFLVLASPCYNNQEFKWTQYMGAAAVVLGIVALMEPLLTNRLSPEFYCEAIDFDNDCTVCQMESTQESCLSHLVLEDDDGVDNGGAAAAAVWRQLHERTVDDQSTPTDSLCQWIPFDEAIREDEILTFIWSIVLIASCIPMTISTFYKDWALGSAADNDSDDHRDDDDNDNNNNSNNDNTEMACDASSGSDREQPSDEFSHATPREGHDHPSQESISESQQQQQELSDPIYLNGWIAVFQLFFAVPLCVLGGWVSSPQVPPQEIWENLRHGFQCYFQGVGSIATTCHPDSLCGEYSFWLVNLHLFTTLGYSFFMLYCLKYGTTTIFFLALTVMVPLGAAAFVLPFMPQAVSPCLSEWLGSVAIVLGLILYRFFDTVTNESQGDAMDEDEEGSSEDLQQPICRAFFALQRDLSACLVSESPRSGDV
mmetsp:Transcript_26042/g.71734  ORF Transcript_26042/g.71734 Transcript_26042/m.71734 type:complete len:750 (+) Transcript_26042:134-2383(+)